MLDIFRSDAFSVATLTDAILKAPFTPSRLGALGLFREQGIPTTSITVEEKDGQLTLVPTSQRGAPADTLGNAKRTARSFLASHLQREATIMADEVQGVRAFGSNDALAGVQAVVNEKIATLRRMLEATLEYHRVGALKGTILDADGTSVIYNLFTEFGISQQTATLTSGGAGLRSEVVAALRLIETELGAEPTSSYRALCGDDFFDQLIEESAVKTSLQYQESRTLREDLRKGFDFGGVTWENYRGKVGAISYIAADEAYLYPEGTDLFKLYFAPADFIETVNTIGLPMYAKLAPDAELNRFVKLHAQSNPLALCRRPRAVVQLIFST